MRKFIKALIFILFITAPFSIHVKAAESITDINQLIEDAKGYDGKEVTVHGEVIGDRMDRGQFTWININDGTNAIGLWVKKSEADKISSYGNYKYVGDTIKITGVFYRACKEHGGEADLHSNSIDIMKEGYQVHEQINSIKIISAVIVMLFALSLFIFLTNRIRK